MYQCVKCNELVDERGMLCPDCLPKQPEPPTKAEVMRLVESYVNAWLEEDTKVINESRAAVEQAIATLEANHLAPGYVAVEKTLLIAVLADVVAVLQNTDDDWKREALKRVTDRVRSMIIAGG